MKILIDANIVIYSLQSSQDELRKWLEKQTPIISAITELEVLGYHRITSIEVDFVKRYFSICEIIPIDHQVIQKAIQLRQAKKMSLGDAIIAATAIVHRLPLITANSKDFKYLKNLEIINPLEK